MGKDLTTLRLGRTLKQVEGTGGAGGAGPGPGGRQPPVDQEK